MSVVIPTDCYGTVRKTMAHLRAQTVRDRLEIVIVVPSANEIDLPQAELDCFLQTRVVKASSMESLSRARALGVRQARGQVVAFIESHSYPAPSWAEALIEAHRQPWAVVGPAVANANPGSMISWSNLLLDYGPWIEGTKAGTTDHLPGHNSSYKREILLEYDHELETVLEEETLLHWELHGRGYPLYLEPRAKIFHLNVSRPSSWMPERFYAGRRFAAARARGWSPLRCLLYAGGAPLIPLVRLVRILSYLRRSGSQRELLPGVLPALIVGLVAGAAGEMVGYVSGAGETTEQLSHLELHKVIHLAKPDGEVEAF
jgi:hypothetical protein